MIDNRLVSEIQHHKSAICQEVLDDLPAWFGIPEAKAAYVSATADLPMFGSFEGEEPVAFLALKRHTPYAAEMYVLAVKQRLHGQGLGRALVDAALECATREGLRFLTVKTLAASHPDKHYAATRKFYEAMGFLPVEVIPKLWGPANPCLLMIRTF